MSRPSPEEEEPTVWRSSAYGDLESLQRQSELSPRAIFSPDAQGYFALQWAALNGRLAALEWLLSRGAPVDSTDPSGQSALHWAAVRGSLPCAEALLRAGARLQAPDSRQYAPLHVAAQYGQAAFIASLIQTWGASVSCRDVDARTPLHWAAYKGYGDAVRALLVLGADPEARDAEQCTPLHWAAIRGNAEAATLLLQGGAEPALLLRDSTGATPAALALQKGHRLLAAHLAAAARHGERSQLQAAALRRGGWPARRVRWARRLARWHLAPLMWAIILGMVAAFLWGVVFHPALASPSAGVGQAAAAVVALASAGLGVLVRVSTSDPGCLPARSTRAGGRGSGGERELDDLDGSCMAEDGSEGGVALLHAGPACGPTAPALPSPAPQRKAEHPALAPLRLSPGLEGQWNQVCVACHIVRPLRAKHDPVTGRCVEVFDHYCPWVGNVVGKNNRHVFLAFLLLELAALLLADLAAVARMRQAVEARPGASTAWIVAPVAFLVFSAFLLLSVGALAGAQAHQIWRNVTTNELANWHRYRYLHGPSGDFQNPFDRGWRLNCWEACHPALVPRAPISLQAGGEDMRLLKLDRVA